MSVILGAIAAATGCLGAVKGGEAILNNRRAKKIIAAAQIEFDKKKEELECVREDTVDVLERYGNLKLEIWDQQFSRCLELFNRVKNVEINGDVETDEYIGSGLSKDELKEMKQITLKASEVLKGGAASLGAGALAGVASYGGAMMFASASTGAAISGLSGAAATNATLAWFGGGSLASGGAGMAGGMVVLGGLVAGPVLAVGGLLLARKAKTNLAEANEKNSEVELHIENMDRAIVVLYGIQALTAQYHELANLLSGRLSEILNQLGDAFNSVSRKNNKGLLSKMKGFFLEKNDEDRSVEYSDLPEKEKRKLHLAFQITQALKIILEKPLLTKEGLINTNSKSYIDNFEKNSLTGE